MSHERSNDSYRFSRGGGCARRTPRETLVAANRNALRVERDGEKWRQRRKQRGVVAENSERGGRQQKDPVFTARSKGGSRLAMQLRSIGWTVATTYISYRNQVCLFAIISYNVAETILYRDRKRQKSSPPPRFCRESQCAFAVRGVVRIANRNLFLSTIA